ncbi:alpha/beta fold hydrolase [uncultured Ruegeria sp.]|uniref:alpha/beta fold hydrolase n=1 Tax=uncultured Ruegeria sp. TaxID=259304 RepID=UPI00260B3AF9|nr:alpha/beta fold hydrolase [uncultured Ruegeria sp.]
MDYFFSVRGRDGNHYSNKPGGTRYLAIPTNARRPARQHEIRVSDWIQGVQAEAGANDEENGHIVIFVHGFNTEQFEMLERHRKIRSGLEAHGFKGTVISYDWPSDGSVLGYNSDRADARRSADKLFTHGIKRLSRMQTPDCRYNIHVLAHSMGTYLVREAMDYADDDHTTAQHSWTTSQVAFVAADISSKSLGVGNPKSSSLLRRCTRLTCYYSPFDEALSISEVKRVGVSRRLGRVGLPAEHPEKAVNLYCGKFFKDNRADFSDGKSASHSWYFDSPRFYEDLHHTFMGKLDREVIPTRALTDRGNLALL